MQRDEIELELRTLIEEVNTGRERLLAGEDFGMQGISQRIDTACKAALALENEEVVTLQPIMLDLRNHLREFSELMHSAMKQAETPSEDTDGGPDGAADGGE